MPQWVWAGYWVWMSPGQSTRPSQCNAKGVDCSQCGTYSLPGHSKSPCNQRFPQCWWLQPYLRYKRQQLSICWYIGRLIYQSKLHTSPKYRTRSSSQRLWKLSNTHHYYTDICTILMSHFHQTRQNYDWSSFHSRWYTVSALNLHHSNSASKLNIPKR